MEVVGVVLTGDTVTSVGSTRVMVKVVGVMTMEACVAVLLPAVCAMQTGVEVLLSHAEVKLACVVVVLPGIGAMVAGAVIMLCTVVITDVVMQACVVVNVAGVVAALHEVMQADLVMLADVVVLPVIVV